MSNYTLEMYPIDEQEEITKVYFSGNTLYVEFMDGFVKRIKWKQSYFAEIEPTLDPRSVKLGDFSNTLIFKDSHKEDIEMSSLEFRNYFDD